MVKGLNLNSYGLIGILWAHLGAIGLTEPTYSHFISSVWRYDPFCPSVLAVRFAKSLELVCSEAVSKAIV